MGSKKSLKVALHGMDSRSAKTMSMFLKRLCHNEAVVAFNDETAHIDIFDNDTPISKKLLAAHLQGEISKPVFVLSLKGFEHKDVISLTKPVKPEEMSAALKRVRGLVDNKVSGKLDTNKSGLPQLAPVAGTSADESLATPHLKTDQEVRQQTDKSTGETLNTVVEIAEEPIKTVTFARKLSGNKTKCQAATQLDERGYFEYIGTVDDVDVNDPSQFEKASYDPSAYYLGAVQTAISTCKKKKQMFALHSHWKSLFLMPRSQEVWLDASYVELKVFSGIKLKHNKKKSNVMTLTPVEYVTENMLRNADRTESMEAFVWKLACWTSMGRYPKEIDFRKPVYLKYWPNFTRLLVTPYALRIAALLVLNPCTMADAAQILNIKPQYVFVFISAAYAIGIVGQGMKYSDRLLDALTRKRNMNDVMLLENIVKKLHSVAG